jgi:hypothetical protein
MKKLILLLLVATTLVGVQAQSLDSEKLSWVWYTTPLIKLPDSLKSFNSDDYLLQIFNLPRKKPSDLILIESIEPAVSINRVEESNFNNKGNQYSQVFSVKVQTKNNKILYYRIFNNFGDIGVPLEPGKPYDNLCIYKLSTQLSLLFSSYKQTTDFKLFTVKKNAAYDDINQASGFVRNAVRMMTTDSITQASLLMEKAVDIWSKALKESNLEDKKARINKKVTEALYKNLIPTLVMLNRFDEAQKLIKESNPKFGMFYGVFTYSQEYYMNLRKLSYKASSSPKPLTLADIELPDSIKLINSETPLTVPSDLETIKKILVGSWRIVSDKANELPKPTDTYNKNDLKNNMCWHFLPNGTIYFQNDEKDSNQLPNIMLYDEYWKMKRATTGKPFFVTADTPDGLTGQFIRPFEIIYCTSNSLLVKTENVNPEIDVKYFYYQLERIKPLSK